MWPSDTASTTASARDLGRLEGRVGTNAMLDLPNLALADDHSDTFMDSYILRGRTQLLVTFDPPEERSTMTALESDNRVAIVTGARPWGVGGATARAPCPAGLRHRRWSTSARTGGSRAPRPLVEETGQRAIWVRADVSNRDDVAEMADTVLGEFGRIDALVNNAAVGGASSTEDFEG